MSKPARVVVCLFWVEDIIRANKQLIVTTESFGSNVISFRKLNGGCCAGILLVSDRGPGKISESVQYRRSGIGVLFELSTQDSKAGLVVRVY